MMIFIIIKMMMFIMIKMMKIMTILKVMDHDHDDVDGYVV